MAEREGVSQPVSRIPNARHVGISLVENLRELLSRVTREMSASEDLCPSTAGDYRRPAMARACVAGMVTVPTSPDAVSRTAMRSS